MGAQEGDKELGSIILLFQLHSNKGRKRGGKRARDRENSPPLRPPVTPGVIRNEVAVVTTPAFFLLSFGCFQYQNSDGAFSEFQEALEH